MSDNARAPYICEPADQETGRIATIIFLHGYGDDAEGIPLGLAQQFQFHSKLPYLRWLLPNAPMNQASHSRAWYEPKALPSALKPRVPGQDDTEDTVPDDEAGILASVEVLDAFVAEEIARGVDPKRLIVGGFSQGCAVSLVWGLIGKHRNHVAGMVCVAGYFPLAERIAELRQERGIPEEKEQKGAKKWFYIHGSKDALVPPKLFTRGKEELLRWGVDKEGDDPDLVEKLYDGMGHSIDSRLLRDLLRFMSTTVPP